VTLISEKTIKKIEKLKHRFKRLRHHVEMSYKLADDEMKFWDAYPRQVGPSSIEELKSHLIIDDETHVETIIAGIPDANLRGYPKGLNRHIMNELTDLNTKGCRVSISFSLVPIPVTEASQMLQEVVIQNLQNQITAKKSQRIEGVETVPLELIFDYEDHRENFKKFHDRKHNVFHSMLIIVLAARNLDTLRTTKSLVMQKLRGKLILAESPQWRQKETFLLAQPFPGWKPYASVEIFSETAAVLAPLRTPNHKIDREGQYYGIDLKTKKKIIVDERKLAARHKLFIGPTGAGKTFTMLMLLMRAHDLLGKRVVITTNKPDVTTDISSVARYYGNDGAVISIGPQGDNINPLQILYDEKEMGNDSYQYVLAYDAHKGLLQKFFDIFLKGTTPPQRSRLDKYINEIYQKKGIYRTDPGSWKNADWPTISDLRELFRRDMKDDVSVNALYHNTFQFEHEGELGYMNLKTNINLSADFIFLDMSNIPHVVKDAMNVLATGVLSMRFRTDLKKETIIAMDEAGNIIRNPEIAEFLLRLITQGRSFGIEAWFATQQPTDLVQANVSDQMKTNIPINIILGENMQKDSIEIVQEYFKLNHEEIRCLLTSSVGKGLLRVQNMSWPIDFKPTKHEMDIIKGQKNGSKPAKQNGFAIKKAVLALAHEQGIIFENWIEGDPSELFGQNGYIKKSVQNALDAGQIAVWIDKRKMKDGQILNESIDHYSTVSQIAGCFSLKGIECTIQHHDDVDIVANLHDGRSLAIEYERPGTHTTKEIFEKYQNAIQKYDSCIIVCTQQNEKEVKKAVELQAVIVRGINLKEFIDQVCVKQ